MSDLIDRQSAIKDIKECAKAAHSNHEWDLEQGYINAIECLEELPSVQVDLSEYSDKLWRSAYERGKRDAQPEIIRCKDCKYRDENWRRVSVGWLPCMDMRTGSNWYCGNAERRTDE